VIGERLRAPLIAWVGATAVASLALLVLVLELGGGAPEAPPPPLADVGPIPAWAIALIPLLRWGAAVGTVGLALIGSGVLDRLDRAPLRAGAVAAIVWSALGALQLGAMAWRLDGQAPLLDSVQARGLLAEVVMAGATAVLAATTRTALRGIMTLTVATVATIPAVVTGHARTADRPALTALAVAIHVVAAVVWIGGLLALCWCAIRDANRWPAPLRRFSRLALACVVAIAVSGLVTALGHVSEGQFFTSAYGAVIVLKAVMLGGLAAFGWLQRHYVANRGGRARRSFVLVAGCELIGMALALALATGLAQTPPPS
jgi:putative copper resistance protein D